MKSIQKKKKSQALSFLKWIILAVIVLVLIILILQPLFKGTEKIQQKTQCKESVLAYSKGINMPLAGGDLEESMSIDCPTQYPIIETTSKTKIKEAVAREMYECWDNFYEGKINLFESTDTKFCVICSVIDFEKPGIKTGDFANYLLLHRIPKKIEGERPTYYTYFTGQPVTEELVEQFRTSTLDIDTNKRYAVLFTFEKIGFWNQMWKTVEYAAPGVGTFLIGGALMIAPIPGTRVGAFLVLSGAVASIGGASAGHEVGRLEYEWEPGIVLIDYNEAALAELGCEELAAPVTD